MLDILKCVASASELIQQSDLYMTVKAVLFTTPTPNLNGVRCTEAFIDEIVANQDAYVGLPLNADIRSLESGQYNKLGHMFDSSTGTFATAIIGSFYKFEKSVLPNGDIGLVGYARIMKRNQAVCTAVGELFASGNLKFSFEISCGSYTTLEDGTMLIDASKDNYLEGMCIVWSPACPEAVAKELVAELTNDGKEAEKMSEQSAEVMAEVTTEETEVIAENEEKVEEVAEETKEVAAEEETTSMEETAAESEEDVKEDPSEEEVEDKEEESAQCKENKKCAEEEVSASVESVSEGVELVSDGTEELRTMIAELTNSIKELKAEIEELKQEKQEKAQETLVAQTNGFMDDISIDDGNTKKYSLLEREPAFETYSLLEVN